MTMISGAAANVVSDDSFLSSPIKNGFMTSMPLPAFSALVPKEEVMESGSGTGHVDGTSCGEENDDDNDVKQRRQPEHNRKRCHRHTARQIQELEALFKVCPHPDNKQRMRLSHELGLKPLQVKFWFQNRRTQTKAQQDKAENVILRAENENLKNENFRLQAAIRNVICPNCSGPAMLAEMSYDMQHFRLENTRLRDKLERLSCIASRNTSCTVQSLSLGPTLPLLLPSLELDMNIFSRHFTEPVIEPCTDIVPLMPIVREQDKGLVLDLAVTAAEHLVRLCTVNELLWVKSGGGMVEVLDVEEYGRCFQWPIDFKKQNGKFRTEATRDTGIVMMNSISLVDAFLDASKWMELFPSIVCKANTLQIITTGISGHGNGSLHLKECESRNAFYNGVNLLMLEHGQMYAELQVLSPLVPTREAHFFRYCQRNAEEGTWMIVDFPIDGFHDGLQISFPHYRRRPSGCVIQDMPNGYARVMWVEHADVEDKPVHQIFNQLVSSGVAFGAARWLFVLQRQCERHASFMARNIPDLGVIPSQEARRNMMKLSQRMVKTFCANISSCNNQSWTAVMESSDDTIRVTTLKNTEPGQPNGVILSAVFTKWLPFSHHQVFDLLTDEQRRSQLDVLSINGTSLHEVVHIANGSHQRNCVSLLRINPAGHSHSQNVELLLQECSTHQSGGSIVVYATINLDAVQIAMNAEDSSCIPLLPTGYVLLPAPSPSSSSGDKNSNGDGSSMGCLLTIGMQVLGSIVPSAKLNISSITWIKNHLCNAADQITAALDGRALAEVDA